MDNKQNRQFYWEVKQFINGNNTPKAPEVKNPSVKDAISGVLRENSVYKQNTFNKNTGTNEVVRSYLNVLGSVEKKNDPGTVMYTKNAVSNPFNVLHEAEQRTLNVPDQTDGAPAKRWRDPKYAEIQKHMDKVKAEQDELKAIRKATREKDEELDFKQELETAGIPVPTLDTFDAEGNKSEKPHAASATARMFASLTKEQRKTLEAHRAAEDTKKLTGLNQKYITTLSSDELYDLKRIQKDQARRKAEKETGGFVLSGPTEAEQEEGRRMEPVYKFVRDSAQRYKNEAAQKARTSPISPGYSSVTPESFETAYNVIYDPRNPTHGRMIQALHGQNTGKAIEGAGTVEGWKTVMGVQAADAEAIQREKRDKEAMDAASQRVIDSDNELRRLRGLSKKEQAAEANKEFEESPEGKKIISQANFDKTVMDAKFADEEKQKLDAQQKMIDATRNAREAKEKEQVEKSAMMPSRDKPENSYYNRFWFKGADIAYDRYLDRINNRTYRNSAEADSVHNAEFKKYQDEYPKYGDALYSFAQRIFPGAKFEAKIAAAKDYREKGGMNAAVTSPDAAELERESKGGLNTPVTSPDADEIERESKGGLNTSTPAKPQASRGMSQRAVASRVATMFGSGRSALDTSRRMNA